MVYEIRFASSAKRHLRTFRAPERGKRLRANPIAPWELRVRDIGVFYEIDEPGVVTVLAIGTKRGNRLHIEGEEMKL